MIGDFQAGGWDEIQGLTLNTTINGTSNFANNGADGFIDPMWNPGSFPAGNDTYIGATFKLGANVHYGWIRVNWNVNGTFIVRGFAYNDTPNAAINAGAEGGSTASIASEEIAVDFTLKENQIEIRANQSIENISIYNTNGQMINAVSKTNILSIDEAVSGLLIVHIIFKNNETSTFKLFR